MIRALWRDADGVVLVLVSIAVLVAPLTALVCGCPALQSFLAKVI